MPGRSKDVNARVEDAVMGDEDVDEVVGTLATTARSERYRYISFEHPGAGQDYITVRVSLYPDEDLRILRTHRAVEKEYDESEHPRDEQGRGIGDLGPHPAAIVTHKRRNLLTYQHSGLGTVEVGLARAHLDS